MSDGIQSYDFMILEDLIRAGGLAVGRNPNAGTRRAKSSGEVRWSTVGSVSRPIDGNALRRLDKAGYVSINHGRCIALKHPDGSAFQLPEHGILCRVHPVTTDTGWIG